MSCRLSWESEHKITGVSMKKQINFIKTIHKDRPVQSNIHRVAALRKKIKSITQWA